MISHPNTSARFPRKARQKVLQLDVHIPWFLGICNKKKCGDFFLAPKKKSRRKKLLLVYLILLLKRNRTFITKIWKKMATSKLWLDLVREVGIFRWIE